MITDITPFLDPVFREDFEQRVPGTYPIDVAQRRALSNEYNEMQRQHMPPLTDVSIEDRTVEGPEGEIPVHIIRPKEDGAHHVVLWIHGGGFFTGVHTSDDATMVDWVLETGCTVVSVDYRLAPEHPYPAGLNDCYAVLQWVASDVVPLGFSPEKIVLGGLSAGGCLAAAVCLMARDQKGPEIALQMLFIPVLDNQHETRSSQDICDLRVWNRIGSLEAWEMYYGPDFKGDIPSYAAPAREEDLSGLPPCYVEVADMDILRDEAIEYAMRLMQAEVQTELHVFPGTYHGSADQKKATISKKAADSAKAALKAVLAGSS